MEFVFVGLKVWFYIEYWGIVFELDFILLCSCYDYLFYCKNVWRVVCVFFVKVVLFDVGYF